MNKPITLCDRCDMAARCLLNYDGVPCRKNRNVEPTNADRIRAMTDEELTAFLWHRDIQSVERISKVAGFSYHYDEAKCKQNIEEWLKSPVEVDE